MKKYIYSILLTLIVPVIVFSLKFNNGYCAAYALDQASQSALSVGAFSDLFDCGIGFDPISISINLSSAYDRINSYLYNRYGWDIEDKFLEGVDTATLPNVGLDSMVSSLSGGIINSVQEASVAGYMLFKDNVLGNYFLGKLNQATETISDVFDNTLIKFDDNLLSKFSNVKSDLLDNDELLNMSNLKAYYGNKFNFVSGYDFASYNFTFSRPLLLYNTGLVGQNSSYYLGVCYPQDYISSYSDLFLSGFGIGTSGTRYNFTGLYDDGYVSYEVINGVTYAFKPLRLTYGGGSITQVSSINPPSMSRSDVISLLQGNDIYSQDMALCYDTTTNSYASLLSLLNMLKGHYVTTDQLDSVYALLGQLTIDTVVDDGISVPSADYAQDIIDALEGVIEGILSDNEVIDDSLGVTPEPPSPDYSNTGISVPSDFPTPILNTLFDSVSLPFNFFSIFQPIFDIFGSSSGLFSLWTFIPSIILIAFIIWALH